MTDLTQVPWDQFPIDAKPEDLTRHGEREVGRQVGALVVVGVVNNSLHTATKASGGRPRSY